MNRLAKDGFMGQLANFNLLICEYYLMRKSTTKPFSKAERAEYLLQLVDFDICGLINMRARYGKTFHHIN